MKRYRAIVLLCVCVLALVPAAVLAQDDEERGARIQLGGEMTIPESETVAFVSAVDANTIIDGSVDGHVFLIGGDTTINGLVDGNVIALGGTLRLGPSAVVTGDVAVNETTFVSDAGSVVQGTVRDDLGVDFSRDLTRAFAWFSLANWVGTTFLALVAGVIFAGIGGRQLWGSAATVTDKPLQSIFLIIVLSILVSMLAALLFFSILGIPLAVLLLLTLAGIWMLGYIVAGTRIGAALTRRSVDDPTQTHPYVPVLVGITLIQGLALVPVIITLVMAYAAADDTTQASTANTIAFMVNWAFSATVWLIGLLGAGALTHYAWRSWTGPSSA